jgi:fructokinase
MSMRRSGVLCFGEALVDFLALPGDGGARHFLEQPGGAPANVAVGVARLGGDARFAGMLSRDMFGDALLAALRGHGVDTSQVRRTDAARTALAFVALDAAGDRSFNFYRPPAADLLFRPEHFDASAFDGVAVFHACSNSLTEAGIADATLHGLRLARDAGALASFDLNLRPALWAAGADPAAHAWRALALSHLVKLSRDELQFLAAGGDEAATIARLFDGATRVLVVTDGGAPIRWWTRDASGEAQTVAVDVVDTTAAGDAFVAGLLRALVERGIGPDGLAAAFEDTDVRQPLLRRAAATGALATTRHGAFAAMPTAAQVDRLLETTP